MVFYFVTGTQTGAISSQPFKRGEKGKPEMTIFLNHHIHFQEPFISTRAIETAVLTILNSIQKHKHEPAFIIYLLKDAREISSLLASSERIREILEKIGAVHFQMADPKDHWIQKLARNALGVESPDLPGY